VRLIDATARDAAVRSVSAFSIAYEPNGSRSLSADIAKRCYVSGLVAVALILAPAAYAG
jgi:hypothetical protein